MTDNEIKRELRSAKDPKAQIKILSELTLIPKERIEQLYREEFGEFIPPKKKREVKVWTKDDEQVLREMVTAGATVDECAAKLSRNPNAVQHKIRNMGMKPKSGTKKSVPLAGTVTNYVPSRANKNKLPKPETKPETAGKKKGAAVEVLNRATELLGKAGFIAIALDAVPVKLDLYSDGENADIFMTLADGLTITLGTKKEEVRING